MSIVINFSKDANMADTLDIDIKKSHLRTQKCFLPLRDEEIDTLATLLTEQHFAAGQTIVTEGDPVESVYLIVSGKADVRTAILKDHIIHTNSVATLGPGDSIGLNETGFYSLTGKRTATVVALTDMVLLHLSITEFHGFALAYSHVNEVMRENAAANMSEIKS